MFVYSSCKLKHLSNRRWGVRDYLNGYPVFFGSAALVLLGRNAMSEGSRPGFKQ